MGISESEGKEYGGSGVCPPLGGCGPRLEVQEARNPVAGVRKRKKMKLFPGRHNSLEKEIGPVLECGQVNEKHSKEKET